MYSATFDVLIKILEGLLTLDPKNLVYEVINFILTLRFINVSSMSIGVYRHIIKVFCEKFIYPMPTNKGRISTTQSA